MKQVLTYADYSMLVFLKKHPRTSVTQMSGAMSIHQTSLSRRMKRFIESGYIKNEIDTRNRKLRRCFLTEKGDRLLEYIEDLVDEPVRE